MRVVISSGHGLYVRGASGYLDEVDEARKVVDACAELFKAVGVEVYVFHDNTSHSQNENLNTIVNYHNSKTRDLDVSVHFNANATTSKPMGTEVLYVTQSALASKVSGAIAGVAGWPNRGGKKRTDLFFLNNTEMPAILLEVCFVDSSSDASVYREKFGAICEAIVESISGAQVPSEQPPEQPPIEPTEARIDLVATTHGDVTIEVNDEVLLIGSGDNILTVNLEKMGNLTLTINGEEFHNWETEPEELHEEIFATWFGGSRDPNNSAYDGSYLNDTDYYVALPYKFQGDRPKVRVTRGELSKEATIMDVGPWMIDDNYWDKGERPVAEQCYLNEDQLPSGPNAGRIPANPAGIDLSPALFKALGMEDNGPVDWEFV
jgi:N-acetylmuramoyl-L-alanine amidase